MIDECIKYGLGLKIPSYHEARVTFLKQEVEDVHSMLERYKKEWAKIGCTLMSDGWTDGKGRSITNFLVNCPMKTVFLKSVDSSSYYKNASKLFSLIDGVIDEIGEDNVVQVVTDNASAYVNAGKLLMEKRRRLFWNPCAAHVLDLILEDIGEIPIFDSTIKKAKHVSKYVYNHAWVLNLFRQQTGQRELKRPGVTRFATCFLTLQSFENNKIALKAMFGSKKWLESPFVRTSEGKRAMDIIIQDKNFWRQVKYCLTATAPLVKVLKLVDGDDKLAMGYIYEAMDRAKEEIKRSFDGEEKRYEKIWEIIDLRWELQLHRPLHAAAYYLNPKFHFAENFSYDNEVRRGYIETIERMYPDDSLMRFKVENQVERFHRSKGTFRSDMAIYSRDKKQPAHWWEMYGPDKEAREFAIRVLSLTCSATGCERNWSIFYHIHSKRRAKMEHERLNSIVFVKYNLKLERRQREREMKGNHFNPIESEDMDSDDEWITEKENPVLEGETDIEAPIPYDPIGLDDSWKDMNECFNVEDVGASNSKKRKRGPRDLRLDKKQKDNNEKEKGKGKGKSQEEVEPDLEEEDETDEDEEALHLDDESDDNNSTSDNDDLEF